MPMDLASFFDSAVICGFHVRPESKINPRNLVVWTILRGLPSIVIFMSDNFDFALGPNIIMWVLSMLRERRFALSQFTKFGISLFMVVSMCLRFGPDENKLESSANIMVDDLSEIVPRSLMYKMKRMGPRMEP